MNWYSVFYWLTVADGVKRFFDVASSWFMFFTIVFFIILIITVIGKAITISQNKVENKEDEGKDADVRAWNLVRSYSSKLFFAFLVLMTVTWLGYVATPSKKDCLMIIAGGAVGNFVTSDSSAKQIPHDIATFLHMSLQKEVASLDVETRKELGMATPKEKFLDKVKNMTKEQLVEYLKSDTTLNVTQ